ncbi:MAG: hypothetical protein AAFU53_19870 [Cyanobacteria bacterium J06632_3]
MSFSFAVPAMPHFPLSSSDPIVIIVPALGYLLVVYFVMMLMSAGTSDT